MNEMNIDHGVLKKKAQDAQTFAIFSLCLKAAIIMMGVVSITSFLILIPLAYIPAIGLVFLIALIPLFIFIAFSWVLHFAYIAFAILAIVYSVSLIETGKKMPDGSLPKEINDKAMFALISSVIIIALLFVK